VKHDYDMVVLGGGAAGLTAAGMSALLGAKTMLVEQHRLGGDCTWTGCVPSKTLIGVARIAHRSHMANRQGLSRSTPEFDFARVMEHVRALRQKVYEHADAPPNFERMGVKVVEARARFLDPHSVELTGAGGLQRISSRFFMIATGAAAADPAFAARALTNETIFELSSRPDRLVVLGAGPVGIEMAQAFHRLGSSVSVVAPGRNILPRDEPELTDLLKKSLEDEGISFVLGHRGTAVEQESGKFAVTLDDGRRLSCDAVLAAIGRKPNIQNLDLENAGVESTQQGVTVNQYCRTSQKHIYASGDVTGRFQFTHMAEHMSKVAVSNAILRIPKSLDEKHVTWATFSDPELARVGATEDELRTLGAKYSVYRLPFTKIDRAITEGETVGLIKVLAGKSGKILGASILGTHGGEMIAEYAVAMRNGVGLQQLSETIHPYPTYMLGNRQTADQVSLKWLDSPALEILGRLFGYRGVRKGTAAL
jgi:pyruvate/2-oxoglutarate dehydrogenase complex dihydrolipoamide dehydrogenase (E3) component